MKAKHLVILLAPLLLIAVLFMANHKSAPKEKEHLLVVEPLETVPVISEPLPETPLSDLKPGQPQNTHPGQPTKTASLSDLDALMEQFKSKEQLFTINPTRDTTLIGEQGTRVHISSESFITKNGTFVSEPVTFSLIECYTTLEMFAHKLSTHTVNNEVIETGGSVKIAAYSGIQELNINQKKSIGLDFPIKGERVNGMQEFKGINDAAGNVVWENKPSALSKIAQTSTQNDNPTFQNTGLNNVSFERKFGYVTNSSLSLSLIDTSSVKLGQLNLANKKEKNPYNTYFNSRFKNMEYASYYSMNRQIDFNVYYNRRGKIRSFKPINKLLPSYIHRDLNKRFRSMPKINMKGLKTNKAYRMRVTYTVKSSNPNTTDITSGDLTKQMSADDANYYSLNVDWLGWVNCDRFLKSGKPLREVCSKIGNGGMIFLICKRIKSRMSPVRQENGAFTFANLPVNEPIRLLAVCVKDGKIYIDSKDLNVSASRNNYELKFNEPKTQEELIAAFKP